MTVAEYLFHCLRSGRQLLFQKHCSGFIQNAVPARPIPHIQAHRQSLAFNFSDLIRRCGANNIWMV